MLGFHVRIKNVIVVEFLHINIPHDKDFILIRTMYVVYIYICLSIVQDYYSVVNIYFFNITRIS